VIIISTVERILTAIELLEKPLTIKELAAKLNVTYGCARKYVEIMSKKGKLSQSKNGTYTVK
jgi:response regulator of citrate/malate metabolism